jgi:hypothetical protein
MACDAQAAIIDVVGRGPRMKMRWVKKEGRELATATRHRSAA